MKLLKLDPSFYAENTHLVEALDNFDGKWEEGKVRGYAVVIINLNDLTFAIPLRTNIKHKASYITVKSKFKGIRGKGLDFSKAVLISKDEHISNNLFKISPNEHKTLQNKDHFITDRFGKYVASYVKAIKSCDKNILTSPEYRFSTLKNYHKDFNL